MSSSKLVPGDIISVSAHRVSKQSIYQQSAWYQRSGLTPSAPAVAPCDVLLLEGTCVVNEAVLTGESVPKSKLGLALTATAESLNHRLDISADSNVNKRNMVYGGTTVILAKPTPGGARSLNDISRPVDGGCLGYVIRTGYYTSQGDMLRNMMYSSPRATANNTEAFSFIFLLLAFAVAAAGYVYAAGSKDARRSQWKLILHCIMIITNVVPPELPLELSYAVNNSVISLIQKGIFCTEPFRIPYAGKIKVGAARRAEA